MKVKCVDARGAESVLKEGSIYDADTIPGDIGYYDIVGENGKKSYRWGAHRFQIIEDEHIGKATKKLSDKTYTHECPCGIQHPARCDYHHIIVPA